MNDLADCAKATSAEKVGSKKGGIPLLKFRNRRYEIGSSKEGISHFKLHPSNFHLPIYNFSAVIAGIGWFLCVGRPTPGPSLAREGRGAVPSLDREG